MDDPINKAGSGDNMIDNAVPGPVEEDKKSKKKSRCCLCCCCCKKQDIKEKAAPTPSGSPSLEAQVAADQLPLRSRKEREQVQRALEEELARQRAQRAMIRQNQYAERFAAGPPVGRGEDCRLLPLRKVNEEPLPLLSSSEPNEMDVDLDMPAGFDLCGSLDDRRREWLIKKQDETPDESMPTVQETTSLETEDQPDTLTLDSETAKEIDSHKLENLMKRLLVQAVSEQEGAKEAEKAEKRKSKKSPADMSVDELVELLREDPEAWDEYAMANSVSSFGLTKPTEEDQKRAKRKRAKTEKKLNRSCGLCFGNSDGSPRLGRSRRVRFCDEVDVVTVPVGKDFHVNERRDFKIGQLKR